MPLKIVKLSAENFKRLKAVEIVPDAADPIVTISGKNGHGKSSVLDAITCAISGREVPEKPILDGQKRAKVEMVVGDYKITRTFTPSGDVLKVEAANGMLAKTPQTFLEGLFGTISIDPMKFLSATEAVQRDTLLRVAGVDFKAIDAELAKLTCERTELGRDAKRLQAEFVSRTHHDDAPETEVLLTDILDRYQKNRDLLAAKQEFERKAVELSNEITQTEDRLAKMRGELDRYNTEAAAITVTRETLAADQAEMKNIEVVNMRVKENRDFAEARKRVIAKTDEYNTASDKIEDLRHKKQMILRDCKFPVEGLSVSDTGILFNGVPLAQVSSSDKIRIATALAMAQKPDLRVIRIADGSLLDNDSMAAVKALAEQHDYQVWIEVVDDSGFKGFYIENGELVHAN